MKYFFALLSIISTAAFSQEKLKSPSEFLGYELGAHFTRHHQVVDYFNYLDSKIDNLVVQKYGETNERRPLMVAILSSPENMANLDEIRLNNLKRTQYETGQVSEDGKTIVWLSYNIHGNEASSTEASMKTLYALADPQNLTSKEWLKNTIVIIDPCINPDGRDRYANFFNQNANNNYNPIGDDIEHNEPWPGGRPNHYLFDLNRDWAWQTQTESASRSEIYHRWMPHIHVDFHEQYINNPYYFAPAAEPFHEIITQWQRDFQISIGKNHAKYFDKNNWLYFTRESFDLLYPSYGDTYPTYNGAIGMTYEQAGHGYAGLGIITEYGDTLTLKDRIEHHYTTGISTVEIASKNADKLGSEFKKYFDDNVTNPKAHYKSYILKNTNDDKIKALTVFLDKHKISYGELGTSKSLKGYSYNLAKQTAFMADPTDLVVNIYQPASRLVTALFEPVTKLSDTLTYDITAWAMPYAYGLEGYALTERVNPSSAYKMPVSDVKFEKTPYAYISKYSSVEDVKWLSFLLKKEVNVRVANKGFQLEGVVYEKGTLVVTQRNNEHLKGSLDKLIIEASNKFNRSPKAVYTGFSDNGIDLGSSYIARIKTPKIAVLMGDQTSSLGFGEIWHFFESQIDYPVTLLGTGYFDKINLSEYNQLIVPNGYYSLFTETKLVSINEWVKNGGKLIVMGNGMTAFKDKPGYALKEFYDEKDKDKEKEKEKPTLDETLKRYENKERDDLNSSIFGAIFKIRLDNTHPLAYGYNSEYFSLKTNPLKFAFLEDGANVGVIKGAASPVSGYAGFTAQEKLEDSLVFGVETKGSGSIIYLVDNPLFRGFWENGKLLFSNAVFMVGN